MMPAAASASQNDNVSFFMVSPLYAILLRLKALHREYGNSISHYQNGLNTGIERKFWYGLRLSQRTQRSLGTKRQRAAAFMFWPTSLDRAYFNKSYSHYSSKANTISAARLAPFLWRECSPGHNSQSVVLGIIAGWAGFRSVGGAQEKFSRERIDTLLRLYV